MQCDGLLAGSPSLSSVSASPYSLLVVGLQSITLFPDCVLRPAQLIQRFCQVIMRLRHRRRAQFLVLDYLAVKLDRLRCNLPRLNAWSASLAGSCIPAAATINNIRNIMQSSSCPLPPLNLTLALSVLIADGRASIKSPAISPAWPFSSDAISPANPCAYTPRSAASPHRDPVPEMSLRRR